MVSTRRESGPHRCRALILSALTVHFRDIRDILGHIITVWFFATPIIYPYTVMKEGWQKAFLAVNPMSHLTITYQEILFFVGPVGHWKWLLALGGASGNANPPGSILRVRANRNRPLPAIVKTP